MVAVDDDGQVHFTVLPGAVEKNRHLIGPSLSAQHLARANPTCCPIAIAGPVQAPGGQAGLHAFDKSWPPASCLTRTLPAGHPQLLPRRQPQVPENSGAIDTTLSIFLRR